MGKKKKSSDGETTNKVMWIAGTAAVTAFAMYYVNRNLNETQGRLPCVAAQFRI